MNPRSPTAAHAPPGVAIPSPLPPEDETLSQFTARERSVPVINWYRSRLPKSEIKSLHERSDALGFLQAGGYLAVLIATAWLAIHSSFHWGWMATVGCIFLYGTVASFLINAVHETGHGTVFKTRWLNGFFCHLFAFLSWMNHEIFNASHTRHHRYTLHPPDDLEVVLPIHLMIRHFLLTGAINVAGAIESLRAKFRVASGRFVGEWQQTLFPDDEPERRKAPVRWARILLAGHALIAAVSLAYGLWIIPVLVSLGPFLGNWLFFLCNNTQHIGLRDNVADFRLCCRTFTLNPVVRFLYWHMNYHTEHHMYAAVPCYRLGRLHALIREDLPTCHHGLVPVWREIAKIQARQAADPAYVHPIDLPSNPRQPEPNPAP
jgi:fatty acid desaturase